MEKISKNSKFCSILFVLCTIMIIFAPYQPDSTLSLSSIALQSVFKVLIYVCTSINLILIVFPLFKGKKSKKANLIQMLSMLIYFFLSVLYTYNNRLNLSGFLFMILWLIFAASPEEIKLKTFEYLKKVWVFISILGIICYLNYILNLFIPYKITNYYSTYIIPGVEQKYVDYNFIYLLQETNFKNVSLIRLCGICNEPGFFGTICALILCASGLKLKKKENLCLLIAGILSFSLGFVLIIVIYMLFRNLKNLKTILISIILVTIYLFVLPNLNTGNKAIDKFIDRMVITNDGLVGDNRSTDEMNIIFKNSIKNKPLFGYGNGYLNEQTLNGGNGTYKSYIIQYGIIGCLLFWGTLLYSAIYKNSKNFAVVVYILAFFSSIYQRPNVMTLIYEILLFGAIEFIKYNNKLEKLDVSI